MKERDVLPKVLTDVQQSVLDFIKSSLERGEAPPSYREIQKHFGFKAVGSVQDHVRALIKKGYLEEPSAERKSRGLRPVGFQMEPAKRIPIYGEIAAGTTRMSEQIELGALTLSTEMVKEPCFALRVTGNSMIEAGIFEGDVVVVEKDAPVKNGDVVVALLNGETTVKRYMKKGATIWLVPENSKMKPIEVKGSLVIQGKVVALQRRY